MKKLFDFYRVARIATESKVGVLSYVPLRGVQYDESLKWVSPEKKPVYDLARSGDRVTMPEMKPNSFYLPFKASKELETANDMVKRVFSMSQQKPKYAFEMYREELVEKVRNHPYDNDSLEVKIAKLTAKIRHLREKIIVNPSKNGPLRYQILLAINKRKKFLRFLRQQDYKKFEWLLETLDLEYRPTPQPNPAMTRKPSLRLLAKLKVEQAKEHKLAALKKSFDEQKVPFLENKIEKLKEIKAKEEKYKLPVTVTDEDIEKCKQRLEEVKIQVAEKAERGYKRKIHPYLLEPYDEKLLWEKEKAADKIREHFTKYKETV